MAAKYFATADVIALMPSAVLSSLFNDGSGFAGSTFSLAAQNASTLVKGAAHNAGYTSLGDTTTSQTVKLASMGQFFFFAYQRKDQSVPEQFATLVNMAESIANGQIPLPELTPAGRPAVGGSDWSETLSSNSKSVHPVMSRSKLRGY